MRGSLLVMAALVLLGRPAHAATEVPLESFARLPQYDQPQLSPDGQRFSYLFPIQGRTHLVVQPTRPVEGDEPTILGPIADADYGWYRWVSRDRLVVSFYFERSRNGVKTVETRLMGIDADGGNPRMLVRADPGGPLGRRVTRNERSVSPAQIQDAVVDFLPAEEHEIVLSVDDDLDGAAEVRVVDVRDGSFRRIERGRNGIQHWMTDQAGELRYGWGYRLRGGGPTGIYRTAEDRWIRVEDLDWWKRGFRPVAFAEDPRYVYALGPATSDRAAVVELDMIDGDVEDVLFQPEGYDVAELVLDPVTRRVVGASYEAERPRLRFFDAEWDALQQAIDRAFPDTINRVVSATPDREVLLVRTSSDREPGRIWAWERSTRRMSPLVSIQQGIEPEAMAPVDAVTYEARDGAPIPAYLTRPLPASEDAMAPPGPAVLMPHGGPHARDTWRYDYWAQFLANRGYTVLQPNFRGSSGYGAAYLEAGRGQWGGRMQDDLSDAAAWLVDQGLADPDRLCIVGASYGGYAALMGAVMTPELFACAVSVNGVTDLVQLARENRRYIGGSNWNESIGLEDSRRRTVSPHHRVDDVGIPVLLVHAEDDARVPLDHARDMHRRLRRAGKTVSLVTLENGGHSLTTEAARATMLEAVEAFLEEHIGGG